MKKRNVPGSISAINKLRAAIIDNILLIFVVLGAPLLIVSISRFPITGITTTYIVQTLIYLALLIVYLLRKKLNNKVKAYFIIISLVLVAVAGLYSFGILGSSRLFLLVAMIFTGLFIGNKESLVMLALIILIFIGFAVLYHLHILSYYFSLNEYVERPSTWIALILVYVFVMAGLSMINDTYFRFFTDSERKLIDNQSLLKKSERNYRTIFNATSEAIIIHELGDGKIRDVNETTLQMFNCQREEFLGRTVDIFNTNIPPYTAREAMEYFKKSIKEGDQTFEWHAKKFSGEFFWVEVSLHAYDNGEGKNVISVVRDITERKATENALRQSQERFRLLIENIPAVSWLTSEAGITSYISPNIEKIYGYTTEEILAEGEKLWFDRIHEDETEKVKKSFQNLFKGTGAYNIEYRIRRKDGEWIWIHDKAETVFESNGVKYALGVFSDITNQKKNELEIKDKNLELEAAEEELITSLERQEEINIQLEQNNEILNAALGKLEENQAKYYALFNNANDAIFLMKDMEFIECNLKTLEMFRVKRSDIIHHSPVEFSPEIQPDGRKSADKALEKVTAAKEGKPQAFEWMHKKSDGESFNTEVVLNAVEIQNETYVQAIVRDVTERKKAELDLIASERNFRNIFQSSNDGIIITDMENTILNANNKILQFLNLTMKELRLRKISEFLISENQGALLDSMTGNGNNRIIDSIEVCTLQSDKAKIPVEANSSVIFYGDRRAILTIIRDITERKILEKKIVQAIIDTEDNERMRFAKELHDGLGPVLSTIKLYFQWLTKTPESEKKNEIFTKGNENIEEAIASLREISNNLSPHVLNNFGLSYAIEQFIERFSATGVKIKYITNTDNTRFKIEIEKALYRIVTELINNTLKHADATEILISLQEDTRLGILKLQYSDNGKGFDVNEVREKKSGIGLFNVENRIDTLGGKISIKSSKNKGMEVNIKLAIVN